MKTYNRDYAETMTVAELVAVLRELPQDAPVVAHWEGQWTPFRSDCIELLPKGDGRRTKIPIVVIDVE